MLSKLIEFNDKWNHFGKHSHRLLDKCKNMWSNANPYAMANEEIEKEF